MRESKQPQYGQVRITMQELAQLLHLPEGMEPCFVQVADPRSVTLVFESESLKGLRGNQDIDSEPPMFGYQRLRATEDDREWTHVAWPSLTPEMLAERRSWETPKQRTS